MRNASISGDDAPAPPEYLAAAPGALSRLGGMPRLVGYRDDVSLDDPTGPIRIHESLLPKGHALHRPRHSQRQRTALACAAIFFATPFLAFLLGVRPQQIENHRLASFPSFAAGFTFFTSLPDWATDHLLLRDVGVHLENVISKTVFGEPPVYSQTEKASGAGRAGAVGPISPQPPSDPGTESGVDGFPQVIQGQDGWMYYGYDMQGKCQPVQPLQNTVSELQRLRAAVERSGRSLVLVVAPDKSTIVPEHLPPSYAGKACAAPYRDQFWNEITAQTGAIDIRAELLSVQSQAHMPIYYQKDTHWTDLGAMTMLKAVVDQIQPGVSTTWKIAPNAVIDLPADLPPMLGERGTDRRQIFSLAPDGIVDRTDGLGPDDLKQPYHVSSRPGIGVVTPPVALLGDSFLLGGVRYLPAVFGDCTAYYYESAAGDPQQLYSIVNNSKVVVIETIERNLAAGAVPLLQPQVVNGLVADLDTHPSR